MAPHGGVSYGRSRDALVREFGLLLRGCILVRVNNFP